MIEEATWQQAIDLIHSSRHAILTSHVNLDGDAVGSEIAMAELLSQLGKRVHILNDSSLPPLYLFLDAHGRAEKYQEAFHRHLIEDADLVVVLDISDWARLGEVGTVLRQVPARRLCVDHHIVTDQIADVMLVDEGASCTGELLFDLAKRMQAPIRGQLAAALYTCVLTDTGSFRFTNTTPKAHRMAAELLENGVPFLDIYERVYEQNSPARLCLLAEAIKDLHFENGGKIAWFRVTQKMLRRCQASYWETENLPEMPRTIQGVEVTIMFTETPDGNVKMSLRSKGRVVVHHLASKFGGGGHPYAAGARLQGKMEQVVPMVLSEAKALFGY
ncbi:MAG: bifunctional oligoribonuclease/PAP phosphatase NrnA [candidate division KSB1 bacterium]|nr:bifunctional oligoribonuclease/PAP phosphatase NrnA [candidate division KSB1 bacterium]